MNWLARLFAPGVVRDLEACTAAKRQAENRLAEWMSNLYELRNRHSALEQAYSGITGELADAQAKAKVLQGLWEHTTRDLVGMRTLADDALGQVGKLAVERDALQANLAASWDKVSRLQAERDALQASFVSAQAKIAELLRHFDFNAEEFASRVEAMANALPLGTHLAETWKTVDEALYRALGAGVVPVRHLSNGAVQQRILEAWGEKPYKGLYDKSYWATNITTLRAILSSDFTRLFTYQLHRFDCENFSRRQLSVFDRYGVNCQGAALGLIPTPSPENPELRGWDEFIVALAFPDAVPGPEMPEAQAAAMLQPYYIQSQLGLAWTPQENAAIWRYEVVELRSF